MHQQDPARKRSLDKSYENICDLKLYFRDIIPLNPVSSNLSAHSRRTFLKSGVALVGVPNARRVWPGEELYLRNGPGYVGLYHGPKLVFELRARFFAGKPSIWFDHSEKQIAFGLESSRHAGLDLNADQTFEFWQSAFGPRAAIHHH